MSSKPGRFARLLPKRPATPDYEIVTPLAVDECRARLAGRDPAGKKRLCFARPLKIDGWTADSYVCVNLPDGSGISGDIRADGDRTRLLLWRSRPASMVFNLLIAVLLAATVLAMLWLLPGPASAIVSPVAFVLAIWGLVWIQQRRRRARFELMTPSEVVEIIANHIQASSIRQGSAVQAFRVVRGRHDSS